MAKTLAQILTDARQIIAQTDAANSSFTDAQLTIWANDAYRRIFLACRVTPVSINNYTAAAEITIDAKTITIDSAKLKNPDNSSKYENLDIINLDELLAMDPDFESATTGIPLYLIRLSVDTIRLYPPPKSSVTALATPLRTYGLELPTDLTSNDTPNLPENLHDIISHWVAFRCFEFLGDDEKVTREITLFRGSLKEQKEVSTATSRKLKRWRWESPLD